MARGRDFRSLCSEYVKSLDSTAFDRYKNKLKWCNGAEQIPEPYKIISEGWKKDPELWPDLTDGDLDIFVLPEYGKIIACDDEDCEIVWFHKKRVNVRRKPRASGFVRTARKTHLARGTFLPKFVIKKYCKSLHSTYQSLAMAMRLSGHKLTS